mmetsp:Transcript_44537/g.78924  ORF Transcript_44537/g.78924 Transcript_44537/m.78924 type:complete len:223 (+) Transcript_44537:1076-1744(+)
MLSSSGRARRAVSRLRRRGPCWAQVSTTSGTTIQTTSVGSDVGWPLGLLSAFSSGCLQRVHSEVQRGLVGRSSAALQSPIEPLLILRCPPLLISRRSAHGASRRPSATPSCVLVRTRTRSLRPRIREPCSFRPEGCVRPSWTSGSSPGNLVDVALIVRRRRRAECLNGWVACVAWLVEAAAEGRGDNCFHDAVQDWLVHASCCILQNERQSDISQLEMKDET